MKYFNIIILVMLMFASVGCIGDSVDAETYAEQKAMYMGKCQDSSTAYTASNIALQESMRTMDENSPYDMDKCFRLAKDMGEKAEVYEDDLYQYRSFVLSNQKELKKCGYDTDRILKSIDGSLIIAEQGIEMSENAMDSIVEAWK